ncbi:hypothetical protein LEMLEM_LOCUS1984 [Lemmus lemmus]
MSRFKYRFQLGPVGPTILVATLEEGAGVQVQGLLELQGTR